MSTPYEQEVILDADGQPIFAALKQVREQIAEINAMVAKTAAAANKGVADYGNVLRNQAKEIQQSLSQVRALAAGKNAPGFSIQDLNANKRLAQATTEATQYARGVAAASNAVEALTAKLNILNREIAARGAAGRGETLRQSELRKGYEEQIRLIKQLDAEQSRMERRASRLGLGVDNSSVSAARARVEAAAMSQNRVSLSRELNLYQVAIDKFSGLLSQAQGATSRMAAQQRTMLQGQLAAAAGEVRGAVSSGQVSPTTALLGARFEQQLRQNQLQKALTAGEAEQVSLARQNLQIADAKVRAAERLTREEQQQVDIQRRLAATLSGEGQRAQVALSQQYAREQIQSLGAAEAIKRVKQETLAAELRLNEAIAEGTAEQIQQARASLATAQAREKATVNQGSSPFGAIMSGRYALAAFARTSVYGAAAAAAYGLFNTIQSGIQNVIELEDEFAKLQAIADATNTQMSSLKASIFDVAANSRFATTDLVKISQTLAQAGVSAGQMTDVLRSVTTLANASGSSPDEAVNLVTSALGAFQLQAGESARVADLMTAALNRTKLTVQQTGQAIQYVGSTAYEQNIGLEQLLATIGAVAQAGVKSGSTIGTGFRQFLVDLQTPTEKLDFQLKALGLTQADVDVKTRGLAAVLETLKNAGFGSSQAYAGLETRAAAFYLTAKNNVDVIDQLQLAFADQGAAAKANERAMDSLTAQWQRFKNLVGDGFAKAGEQDMQGFKSMLKGLNDALEGFGNQMTNVQTRWYQGWSGYVRGAEGNQLLAYLDYMRDKFWMIAANMDLVENKQDTLANSIAKTSDEISQQNNLIDELQKEYTRLLTQKDSLINNDQRSASEMSNLMQRFEGLSGYLTNTRNLYTDLTNAVRGFIAANQEALAGSIATQQSNLAQQSEGLRTSRGTLATDVRNDPNFKKLDPKTQAAVASIFRAGPGTDEFRRAIPVVADAARTNAGNTLGPKLNSLVTNMQQGQANQSTQRTLVTQRNTAEAASTTAGSQISTNIAQANALIAQGKYADASKLISTTRTYMKSFKVQAKHQGFMADSTSQLDSMEAQIRAAQTPTPSQTRASQRYDRDSERQARLMTQGNLDSILSGFGLNFSRGHDESPSARAAQNALHARGLTNATADTSGHTRRGGLARDLSIRGVSDEDAKRMAVAIRKRLIDEGVPGEALDVRFETGKGKNQGTGRHIHVSIRPGAKLRGSAAGTAENKLDQFIDQKQLQSDQRDLEQALADMAKATTTDTFSAAAAAAKAALEKVNEDLRNQAKNELAGRGVLPGDPEWEVRMGQIEQQIKQNTVDYQSKIADAIVTSLSAMLKAAEQKFNEAIAPALQAKALADAQLSGLDYASNDGKVPDYVRVLAQRRAGQAAENVDRARASALPAEVAAKEAALAQARANLSDVPQYDANGVETAAYQKATQAINEQVLALQALRNEKVNLDAALNASAQIPTTLSEGLHQAIQAYEETHKLNNTFQQDLIMNMGGALDTVHESFTNFFTEVMTGTKSIGAAFGDMVMSVINYLAQLAAKWAANQAFKAILNAIGGSVGGGDVGGSVGVGGAWWGGKAEPQGYLGGGRVSNGSAAMDSVNARLARGEWVINRRAVDSVGDGFMARLNTHGSKALDSLRSVPQIVQAPQQNTNVYVVAPDKKPTLTKNDVLVVVQEDMLNGESRKLVRTISQGG